MPVTSIPRCPGDGAVAMADPKAAAGEAAAERVRDGMVVGLGTGSTTQHAIHALARRVRAERLDVMGIPTSKVTEELARREGLRLTTLEDHPEVDIAIDGADEVSPKLDLIKGLGGALVREKIVASAAKAFVVVVEEGKLVEALGTKAPLPVEVIPFGWSSARRRLEALGANVERREEGGKPFVSDNGNYILHARFPSIPEPAYLAARIAPIPGVVDHGLFLGMTTAVLVGGTGGVRELTRGRP